MKHRDFQMTIHLIRSTVTTAESFPDIAMIVRRRSLNSADSAAKESSAIALLRILNSASSAAEDPK